MWGLPEGHWLSLWLRDSKCWGQEKVKMLDFGVKETWISALLCHSCVAGTNHVTSLSCSFFTIDQGDSHNHSWGEGDGGGRKGSNAGRALPEASHRAAPYVTGCGGIRV